MQTPYAVARTAANRIHEQFRRYQVPAVAFPDAPTLSALIDAAFWTSLRREELYTPRISFAFVAPYEAPHPISLATSLALTPGGLTKLAAGVERSGIHLCVRPSEGELRVWGIALQLPALRLVIEIVGPGLLVVKRSPLSEAGKFLNLAVLQGDEIKIVDPQVSSSHRRGLLRSSLPSRSTARVPLSPSRPNWAERGIWRPRSSCTISMTPSAWWRRRTAGLRFLAGRTVTKCRTPIASTCC